MRRQGVVRIGEQPLSGRDEARRVSDDLMSVSGNHRRDDIDCECNEQRDRGVDDEDRGGNRHPAREPCDDRMNDVREEDGADDGKREDRDAREEREELVDDEADENDEAADA